MKDRRESACVGEDLKSWLPLLHLLAQRLPLPIPCHMRWARISHPANSMCAQHRELCAAGRWRERVCAVIGEYP